MAVASLRGGGSRLREGLHHLRHWVLSHPWDGASSGCGRGPRLDGEAEDVEEFSPGAGGRAQYDDRCPEIPKGLFGGPWSLRVWVPWVNTGGPGRPVSALGNESSCMREKPAPPTSEAFCLFFSDSVILHGNMY